MTSPTDTAARHGVGGNKPPISELLSESYKDLIADAEKWIGSANRAPTTVDDDDALRKFGTIAAKLGEIARSLELKRKAEKEPYLTGGREVDAFFNVVGDKIAAAGVSITDRQRVYMRAKDAAARAAADAEAARQREEAAAALRAAEKAQDAGNSDEALTLLDQAAAAETASGEAQARSEASPADLVRTRADSGALITAKKVWVVTLENRGVFESTTPDRGSWGLISPYIGNDVLEKAAKAAVKNGVRSIPGFKIIEDIDPLNRS